MQNEERAILSKLIDGDTLKALSEYTKVDETKVRKILAEALPQLMRGVEADAKDNGETFEKALSEHAAHDASDPLEFLKNADAADGEKILGYLLGEEKESVQKSAAEKSGVSNKKTALILALCAPLLLSLLGQQGQSDDSEPSILGSLLGGSGSGGLAQTLMGALLGGNTGSHHSTHHNSNDLGGALLSTLLGGNSGGGNLLENLAGSAGGSLLEDLTGSGGGNLLEDLAGSAGGSEFIENIGGELLGSLLGGKTDGKRKTGAKKTTARKRKSTKK